MQAVQLSIPINTKPVASIDVGKKQKKRAVSKAKIGKARCASQKRNSNFDFAGVAG